ncbi:hypothetical protein A2W14_06430 [Candidatus Gottesmanbacteria bacterium RBG_16_37_8]|uniref:Uncharacterized protein n=1 Tax=Candidatus Gottesmanbacteria bacterium RBG_16_37_8 TaxID=1798371 RepID=A0A1F5YSA4_9BACT|nr:MAG: hypothetical protein A2W14_06430 [Candidatus Gottesmanbacteria bacterium RBG_16_37_8]
MLPKKWRIKLADFNQNPKPPIKRFSPNFNLFIKKSNTEGLKFIIHVPFSLDKRAVKRNQTRRRIEQIILENFNNLKGKGEALIRTRKIIDKNNRRVMGEELKRILNNEFH